MLRKFGRYVGVERPLRAGQMAGVIDPFMARVEFVNGYEASVVRHAYSYGGDEGLVEIAVLHDGELVYDTPVTGDVRGFLDEDEVIEVLAEIERLPAR